MTVEELLKEPTPKSLNPEIQKLYENTVNKIGIDKVREVAGKIVDAIVSKDDDSEVPKDIDVMIYCHNDLDGHTSGFFTKELCHEVAYTLNSYIEIRLSTINYGYSEDKLNYPMTEPVLDDASDYSRDFDPSIVFVVDYSMSKYQQNSHMQYFYDMMEAGKTVVWIDHHQSSLSLINETDENELGYKFMRHPNLIHLFYTEIGVSAAMLCYMVYCAAVDDVNKRSDGVRKHSFFEYSLIYPSAFPMYVSLYDTFHPLSDRRFFSGMRLMHTEPDLYDFPEDMSDLYSVPNCIWHVFETGKAIVQSDYMTNTMGLSSQGIEFSLDIDGEIYTVIAMNRCGNSFIFEKSYDDHDAVMTVWFDNHGKYRYSMYARRNPDHQIPCNKVAEFLGGGGHVCAAGWQLDYNVLEDIYKHNVVKSNTPIPYTSLRRETFFEKNGLAI